MGSVAASCLVLLIATTFVHYEVLRLLSVGLPALHIQARPKLIVVILGTSIAHAAEILLYGLAFYLLASYFGEGTLGDPAHLSFARCLYFSAETYSSLGYGDIVPTGDLRLLAGMEALNGLLLIGWTGSYTYIAMARLWGDDVK
jgi:hypothetical protein